MNTFPIFIRKSSMNKSKIDITKANRFLKNRIDNYLTKNDCSLRNLADDADIPYDTLKKLANAKIENPSLTNLLKLSRTFHCSIDYLIGRENQFSEKFSKLPRRAATLIEALVDLETSLTFTPVNSSHEYIPLFIPTGNLSDGMHVDSSQVEVIDIAPYRSIYGEKLMCGLQITNNSMYPVYSEGDILLLGRDRQPLYGETVIYLQGSRIFIRILKSGIPPKLFPVNGIGQPVILKNPEEWQILGYVLTLYRGFRQ